MEVLEILLDAGILVFCFAGMEAVAWLTHRFVMHGFLWVLHKDHHVPHKPGFEKNDLFVVIFASPAVVCLVLGISWMNWHLISAGAGITLYGIGYTLFHDVMFHRRLKWLKIPASTPYLKRMVNAHRNHHKSTGRLPGEAFGFLWAPRKYHTG